MINKGLFINPQEANCSIYESGRMMYEALSQSHTYTLDYMEIDEKSRDIPGNYDFYAFNYHYITMGWLDTKSVRNLPGLRVTFVLESLPNNPFVLCPPDDFDAYCVLDPTMRVADNRIYPFSRPLEVLGQPMAFDEPEVPVIGSFGFATPGKGFELIVDAVNREFDEAVIKLNIPRGTYADSIFDGLHNCNYSDYLSRMCVKLAKKGIQVIISNNYMNKLDLIKWCSRNTLNCFLYNRDQPGLSATTDQAITSGRPLAISTNETFRHIHRYVQPYPYRSLKESIALSRREVLQMQQEWAPDRFVARFESVLKDFHVFGKAKTISTSGQSVQLKKKGAGNSAGRILKTLGKIWQSPGVKKEDQYRQGSPQFVNQIRENVSQDPPILIVSHKEKQCGIYQYGANIFEALKKSQHYRFVYSECSNPDELQRTVNNMNPQVIIYNYYPATMPWLTADITRSYTIPQLGLMHEVTQSDADKATDQMFDFHLCPDPTLQENNRIVIKTKRLILPYINMKCLPDVVTIGSFGFGFADKGFARLIEIVQTEFDRARIVLHLPANDIVDKKGKSHAIPTAKHCRKLIRKPGIDLVISQSFVSKRGLLDFLAGNTLNAFFYDAEKCRGISSTIEYALAVQRPLAITRCGMFRHVSSAVPSICIEDSSISNIIDNDIVPLVPFYNEWSEAAFIKDYEQIMDRVISLAL